MRTGILKFDMRWLWQAMPVAALAACCVATSAGSAVAAHDGFGAGPPAAFGDRSWGDWDTPPGPPPGMPGQDSDRPRGPRGPQDQPPSFGPPWGPRGTWDGAGRTPGAGPLGPPAWQSAGPAFEHRGGPQHRMGPPPLMSGPTWDRPSGPRGPQDRPQRPVMARGPHGPWGWDGAPRGPQAGPPGPPQWRPEGPALEHRRGPRDHMGPPPWAVERDRNEGRNMAGGRGGPEGRQGPPPGAPGRDVDQPRGPWGAPD